MCVICITGQRALTFECSVEKMTNFVFLAEERQPNCQGVKLSKNTKPPRGGGGIFSLPQNLLPGSGVRPDVCSMGTGVSFPRGKVVGA